jgi:predicted aspartyl protease
MPIGETHRKTTALAFEAKKPGQKPFPFALVEGHVGDHPTRFIVDTGASVHAIDATVAKAAKLPSSVNASVISLEGWGALPAKGAVVVELPAPMRAHGIGGIVSPQLLAEGGDAIVVDFVKRELRLRPKSTAWSEVQDAGAMLTPPEQRKYCAVEAAGVSGLVLAVDASVEGEATRLAIDTGASRSMLVNGAKAGARAVAHPVLGRSVALGAASDVAAAIHGGVPFTIGAWKSTVDVGVAPGERHAQCGHEGRIGLDVLAQCALAMTADEFVLACRAPGQ